MSNWASIYNVMIIYNPFFLYAISWLLVLFLYKLEWSSIYPKLCPELLWFLLITSFISIILAIYTNHKKTFLFRGISSPLRYYNVIKKYSKWNYILLLCEFLFERSVPLLSYIKGNASTHLYAEFGLPIIHVFVINVFFLLFYFSSYCYFSEKGITNKFIRLSLLNFLPALLCMSRGFVLYMIFGFLLLLLMSAKKIKRIAISIVPISIVILYLFGVMGNLRINDREGNMILNIGQATSEFYESDFPFEFFWAYLYISSPLANLQNAIDEKKVFNSQNSGLSNLIGYEMLPVTISKRIGFKANTTNSYLISDALTVGSTYMGAYLSYGWLGMILIFGTIMYIIYKYSCIINRKALLFVPMIIVLSILAFFSMFSNMLVFVGLYPQLVLIYIFRNKYDSNIDGDL